MRQRFTGLVMMALALVMTMNVGCKPETDEHRDIIYTVEENDDEQGGVNIAPTVVKLETEKEWDALLERFCDYAMQGGRVTFYNISAGNKKSMMPTKAEARFSTKDRDAMKAWCAQMEKEGMTVSLDYDPKTGTWNGVAYMNVQAAPTAGQTYKCVRQGITMVMTFDSTLHQIYMTSTWGSPVFLDAIGSGVFEYRDTAIAGELNPTIVMVNTMHRDAGGMLVSMEFDPDGSFTLRLLDTIPGMGDALLPDFYFTPDEHYAAWVYDEGDWNVVLHIDTLQQRGCASFPTSTDCMSQFLLGRFTYEYVDTTIPGLGGERVVELFFPDLTSAVEIIPITVTFGVTGLGEAQTTWYTLNEGCHSEYTMTRH